METIGLAKFDFLDLTALTRPDRSVCYIKRLDPALGNFDLAKLLLNNRTSSELLVRDNIVAAFPPESRGM